MLVDETNAQGPEHNMVQVAHAEWARELREVQKKFADDMASEMRDVKNDLVHVRGLLGVLIRRERCAKAKTEIEKDEADDARPVEDREGARRQMVRRQGYGFGKAPTGEVAFIHASAVQSAEVLMIGTDAWVQVKDNARAQGGFELREPRGARHVQGREGQRESAQSGSVSEASSGTDSRTCSSV